MGYGRFKQKILFLSQPYETLQLPLRLVLTRGRFDAGDENLIARISVIRTYIVTESVYPTSNSGGFPRGASSARVAKTAGERPPRTISAPDLAMTTPSERKSPQGGSRLMKPAVCDYFRPADRNDWNAACASGDLSAALNACISAAI